MVDDEIREEAGEAVAEKSSPIVEGEASADEFAAIREHFEQGVELSDDEVDKIADTAIGYIRAILACFGENQVSVDERRG